MAILSQLPGHKLFVSLMVLTIALWVSNNVICRYFSLAIISFLWGCWHGTTLLTQINILSQGDSNIIATVKSINLSDDNKQHDKQKVVLAINQIDGRRLFPPVRVSVIWPDELKPFCAGQQWKLKLRMRPIHSLLNQGGFDSQRWAIANRQPLSGKIISSNIINDNCNFRQKIISGIKRQIGIYNYHPILLALAFGEPGRDSTLYFLSSIKLIFKHFADEIFLFV